MDQPPNILLLIDDEHRADVAGYEGNLTVRTPHLDRLAADGVWFRNAYCTSPVCVPSRQSFLSGKLPSTIGCRKFGDPFDSEILTLPGHLARYGYNTVAFGKMHFEDADQMHGWTERPSGDMHVRIRPQPYDHAQPPALARGAYREMGMGFWGPAKEVRNARTVSEEEGIRGDDNRDTDAACRFLRTYYADSTYDRPRFHEPLCLCLSLQNPHYPFQCARDEMDYYLPRVAPFLEGPADDHPCHRQYAAEVGKDVTEREVRRATAAYYGQVEFADRCFGRILDTLTFLGVRDQFVTVFLSDHGEMLGQHGLWEKKQFFDASVRVPLIIHDPRAPGGGRCIDEVVSLLDVFPTVCDLAGLRTPGDLQGRSLAPLLAGDTAGWRNSAISELWSFYHQNGGRGNVMLRKGPLKFIRYGNPDYRDQLFDLVRDPQERRNLLDDAAYAEPLAELRRMAEAHLEEAAAQPPRPEESPIRSR